MTGPELEHLAIALRGRLARDVGRRSRSPIGCFARATLRRRLLGSGAREHPGGAREPRRARGPDARRRPRRAPDRAPARLLARVGAGTALALTRPSARAIEEARRGSAARPDHRGLPRSTDTAGQPAGDDRGPSTTASSTIRRRSRLYAGEMRRSVGRPQRPRRRPVRADPARRRRDRGRGQRDRSTRCSARRSPRAASSATEKGLQLETHLDGASGSLLAPSRPRAPEPAPERDSPHPRRRHRSGRGTCAAGRSSWRSPTAARASRRECLPLVFDPFWRGPPLATDRRLGSASRSRNGSSSRSAAASRSRANPPPARDSRSAPGTPLADPEEWAGSSAFPEPLEGSALREWMTTGRRSDIVSPMPETSKPLSRSG